MTDDIILPKVFQTSAYHEGVILLLAYSGHQKTVNKLAKIKRSGELVKQITEYSDRQLQDFYELSTISIDSTENWGKFLKHLQVCSRKYNEAHPIVLGSIIEIMGELNWQDHLNLRKLLVFLLQTDEELAHLRLALSGTSYQHLASWRRTIISEARGFAVNKSGLQ